MDITRPSIMEVDLEAFKFNILQIKNYIVNSNVKIMPVIKANAYGTWINKCIDIINEFDVIAIATVDEAEELRNLGYKKDIFLLNQPYIGEVEKIVENDVTIGVSSTEFINQIGEMKKEFKIHIEIGTGMGRTGINPNRTEEFICCIKKYSNIKIEGIYTHLSSADTDFEYTAKQLNSFKFSVETAEKILGKLKYIHSSASNGILNFKNSYYNVVRPGIIMYGYNSSRDTSNKLDLKPVCKLKSKITFLKKVNKGTSIGYSRSFITNKETLVATIPMGYADGIRRNLSNIGEVVVNRNKARIIGNICMDSFMIDVTEIDNVNIGNDVYIWDNDIITVDEIAKKCDTINYEIITGISCRVPRIFLDSKN